MTLQHLAVVEDFLRDLKESVITVSFFTWCDLLGLHKYYFVGARMLGCKSLPVAVDSFSLIERSMHYLSWYKLNSRSQYQP